jgi:hypothetical protein
MNAKGGAAFALFRTDLQPKNLLITFDALTAQLVLTIAKNSRNCGPHLKRRTLCVPGLCIGVCESGGAPAAKQGFCARRHEGLEKRKPLRLLSENSRSMRNIGNNFLWKCCRKCTVLIFYKAYEPWNPAL